MYMFISIIVGAFNDSCCVDIRLFPMGDMPEILVSLIAKGKAVLWSSQIKKGCKVKVYTITALNCFNMLQCYVFP